MKQAYPDGPRVNIPLLIMGQMLPRLFPLDPLGFGVEVARRYGDIAHYKVGPLHIYQLNHPDLIRQVVVEQPETFVKPKLMKRVFRPFAGDGLLTSDGAFWKRQRSLMQPAFHQRHLAAYGDVMVAQALGMTEGIADGEVRDIAAEMAKLTLRIVVRTLFGSDLPREAQDIGAPMTAVLDAANERMNNLLQLPSWVPTRRNVREKRAIARLDAILDSFILARRASRENGEGNADLLSRLLAAVDAESGDRMSDQQLHDEMMTLFLAGHETTAGALTWIWYLLSQNPDAEAKLLEELHGVLGGRAPAMTDLPKLPYTDMVVREAIRLYPPAPQFAREPIRDVSIGKYVVVRGSLILVNTYALQRDERFFAEPERFDPERFAKGWEERIPRYAYLPFGGGPRVCIGNGFAMMEARLVLATVAQRYRLSLEPGQDIRPVQLVTLRPNGPVRMQIERRAAINSCSG
jgi:cytochrome P450